MNRPARSGLVLAGGSSRRMGTDKALLTVEGRRLVDRVLAVLSEVADDLVCARGDRAPLGLDGVLEVTDAVPGAGPLAGLVSGLEAARHDLVAVLAVDLPSPSAAVLRHLAAQHAGQDAIVPVVAGRLQPLHAVWSRRAAPALRGRLEDGDRSLHAALRALTVTVVGPEGWGDLDDGSFARDLDAPVDLDDAGRPTGEPEG